MHQMTNGERKLYPRSFNAAGDTYCALPQLEKQYFHVTHWSYAARTKGRWKATCAVEFAGREPWFEGAVKGCE